MPPFFDHDQQHKLLISARSNLSQRLRDLASVEERLIHTHTRLVGIDEKVPSLQSAMAPIQDRASVASALTSQLDATLHTTFSVIHIFESIHTIQAKLNAEDPKHDLRKYLAMVCSMERYLQTIPHNYSLSLDSLDEVLDFLLDTKLLDPYSLRMLGDQLEQSKRLDPRQEMMKKDPLNKALLKLEEEFERLLTESSRVIDLSKHLTSSPGATGDDQTSEQNTAPFPTPRVELMDPDTSNKLLVISDRLKVNGRIEYCLEVYKEIRVKIVMKSIVTLKPEYLRAYSMEELNRMEWEDIRGNLSLWLRHVNAIVMVLMAQEKEVCERAFHTLDPPERTKCFADIVKKSNISIFFRFIESAASTNHRPEAMLVELLEIIQGLGHIKYEMSGVFGGCPDTLKEIEAMHLTLSFHVLRVYRILVINTETWKSQVPSDGGKDLNARYIVNYMGMIFREYKGAMAEALRLQQRSAKASGGGAIMVSNLQNTALSIMGALEKSLEHRASTCYEDPILAHVFLMNNYRHVLVRLKECVQLADCLGEDFKTKWRRKVDLNMRNYIKKVWENVVSNLGREGLQVSGGRGVSRDLLMKRVKAFNIAFEEVCRKQVRWVILDDSLRESVFLEVTQLLVPAYHAFMQSYGSYLDEGVPPQLRVNKYTVDMLENMVRNLFQGK